MSDLVWRVTPVNGYDIPGLERWLEKMAAKGLRFAMTAGPLTAFERDDPADLQIHLEPAREKTDQNDPQLVARYWQAGWRYLGIFRKQFYLFATEDREAQAHTNPETWFGVLKRFLLQKLRGGLWLFLFHVVLLHFWYAEIHEDVWRKLAWSPVLCLSEDPLIALAFAVVGLVLVDLAWLIGCFSLFRDQIDMMQGERPEKAAHGGFLLVAGVVVLTVVLADTFWTMFHLGYRHLPLEGSGFITLAEIEGPGFLPSEEEMFYMDHVSYNQDLLLPEHWFFVQYAAFQRVDGSVELDRVPNLSLSAYRYRLHFLAEEASEELSRIRWSGMEYEPMEPVNGLDEVLAARYQNAPEDLPCTRLILRQGNTVMLTVYCGRKDVTQFLPRFAKLMSEL